MTLRTLAQSPDGKTLNWLVTYPMNGVFSGILDNNKITIQLADGILDVQSKVTSPKTSYFKLFMNAKVDLGKYYSEAEEVSENTLYCFISENLEYKTDVDVKDFESLSITEKDMFLKSIANEVLKFAVKQILADYAI